MGALCSYVYNAGVTFNLHGVLCNIVQPDVIELRQQMSPSMTMIQMAVLEIIKACIIELKRYNPCVSKRRIASWYSVPGGVIAENETSWTQMK